MDRNLAIALLAFDRPGAASELSPTERAALDAFVASDPALAESARRQNAEDRAFAGAMAVAVPAEAKSRALARLLARRSTSVWRQRLTAASLAAAAFLAVGLAAGVTLSLRPTLDGYAVAYANEQAIEAPEQTVRAYLAGRGLPPGLPAELDYGKYLEHGTQSLEGRDVPVVTFVLIQPNATRFDYLKVHAVTNAQFRLDGLEAAQSSLCTTTVLTDPRAPGVRWVLVHTTPTIEPFLKPQRAVSQVR